MGEGGEPFAKKRKAKTPAKKAVQNPLSPKDQGVLLRPETDWCPPNHFPSLASAKFIAVDTETKDPLLMSHGPGWPTKNGYIVGVSVATDDGFCGYYPIRHGQEGWDSKTSGNLPEEQVLRWLRTELGREEQPKIFAHAEYDIGWLRTDEVAVRGPWYDIQIAAPLIDEHRQWYNLDSLARDYIDERKNNKLLDEAARAWGFGGKAGAHLWKLPAPYVGPYAEQDALATLKVWDKLRVLLEQQGLWDLFKLEASLQPALIAMRARGMRVDQAAAERAGEYFLQRQQDIVAEIKTRYCDVDLWEANSLARAFDIEGIKYNFTAKTGRPQFQKEWLAEKAEDGSKLADLVLKGRRYDFARRTFIRNNILEKLQDGRIYAEAHSMRSDDGGTVSGRFSYRNPNLQQIPARDPEIGPLLRALFLPEEGHVWASADYSQQEPRLTVHYASLAGCEGAEDARLYYCTDPKPDYHTLAVRLFEKHGRQVPRSSAKILNLGLQYGMGVKKLAYNLGVSEDEAREIIGQYHEAMPFVKGLSRIAAREAATKGFIFTILKRRCRFERWEPRRSWEERQKSFIPSMPYDKAVAKWGRNIERSETHKAMNRLIQGSAADQTKLAMSQLWELGYTPALQVHDELCFSLPVGRTVKDGEGKTFDLPSYKDECHVREVMERCIELRVPVKVELKIGSSWGECVKEDDYVPWIRGVQAKPARRKR